MRQRAWLSWSSGKDSVMALHEVRSAGEIDVIGLLTTVNTATGRVAMHDVRRVLLEAQAAALGLPLHIVELPWPCPNPVYEQQMSAALEAARQQEVSRIVYGDLFLQDIRAYREASLAGTGLTPVFPLWHRPTAELAREILACGIRAVITCVDPSQAPAAIAGLRYDQALLRTLPATVDPCGENGEFHTFATDGPGFSRPVEVTIGASAERDGFVFTDIRPGLGAEPGLCAACRHAKLNETRRGTVYLRCTRAEWDPALPRYPRLPVTKCAGFEQ